MEIWLCAHSLCPCSYRGGTGARDSGTSSNGAANPVHLRYDVPFEMMKRVPVNSRIYGVEYSRSDLHCCAATWKSCLGANDNDFNENGFVDLSISKAICSIHTEPCLLQPCMCIFPENSCWRDTHLNIIHKQKHYFTSHHKQWSAIFTLQPKNGAEFASCHLRPATAVQPWSAGSTTPQAKSVPSSCMEGAPGTGTTLKPRRVAKWGATGHGEVNECGDIRSKGSQREMGEVGCGGKELGAEVLKIFQEMISEYCLVLYPQTVHRV